MNETTAELPSEWKGYAWSTDYQELYDLLKTGVRAVCLAPYRRNIWDICYARFDATYGFDFVARGISYTRSYPSDNHSFEAFEKLCKEGNIVFLTPDSTSQIAALEQDVHDLAVTQIDYQKLTHEQREQIAALRPALEHLHDKHVVFCESYTKATVISIALDYRDYVRDHARKILAELGGK